MDVPAADLQHYLQQSRESVLHALDGLDEYDVRRPLVPSGTNLLGLVKHLVGLYREVWVHSDTAIAEVSLRAPALVPWWPEERRETTFGHLLIRTVAETARHAGHADILREMVDGRGGRDHDDVGDARWWDDHVARIQAAADAFRPRP